MRKENIYNEQKGNIGEGGYNSTLYGLLTQAYAGEKAWYNAAKTIKAQDKKDFLELNNEIDNYLLGSFLLAFKEYEQASKYFKHAIALNPDLYDAKRKLNICLNYLNTGMMEKENDIAKRILKENLSGLNVTKEVIEIFVPNFGFEVASKRDKTKPGNWSYYSGSKLKEDNPWGLSAESHSENHSCYQKQFLGNNAWLFSGDNVYNVYRQVPSDDYALCPDTGYQISVWIKANRPMVVILYCVEYSVEGNYTMKKLSGFNVSTTYQKFVSPIIFSDENSVKYRIGFNLWYQKGEIFVDDVVMEYLFLEE